MLKILILSALLVVAAAHARAAAADEAAKEASLRAAAESVLTMSDEDYGDMARRAPEGARWAKLDRSALLKTAFDGLARSRRRRAVASPVSAGRSVADDAAAAGPDNDLLTETGWWSDAGAWVRQYQADNGRTRGVTAVAAVRGGRKLSSEADKEVSRLLASVDAGDKALSDASLTPEKRGQIHLEAAAAYGRVAEIVGAEQPPPAAVAAPAPAKTLSAKEIYQRAAPSVVLILAADKEGAGELGTGSVVEGGNVLTNAHVVVNDKTGRPFSTVRVYLKPAQVTGDSKRDLRDPVAAKVLRYDRGLDLAVLAPESKLKAQPLTLGDDSSVEPGDPVVAIGHPEQGGLWTLTQGVISTVIADLGGVSGKDAFQTDASINRGNSGGPLIDRSGAQIGVNTSMARKAADGLTITSVNFSVKSSVVRRWLGTEPAAAAAAPAVARTEPPAPAPVAALPPPPKTRPVVVTPQAPYRIESVIEAEMREMDDLEDEMRREIESRRR